ATIPSIMSHRPGINAGPKIAPETDAHLLRCICRLVALSGHTETDRYLSASLIGHSGSSAFRLSTTTVSMSLTGSCFSSESAPGALPSWDSRTRRNDLSGGLAVRRTVGPSGHANSPHPSSREGHHSTARWRLECPYGIRCCTVFMLLLLWPVLGSSG